jgi:hypothetical protein
VFLQTAVHQKLSQCSITSVAGGSLVKVGEKMDFQGMRNVDRSSYLNESLLVQAVQSGCLVPSYWRLVFGVWCLVACTMNIHVMLFPCC